MLALPHVASGKVREIYAVGTDQLLFVATDRISAYDVILSPTIPDKGRVLTGVSLFFFDLLDVPNHLVTTDLSGIDELDDAERSRLAGRAMVVRRAEVLPMECVVRGYLYGSSWREYEAGGGPTTEHLPAGLRKAERLEEPIFTPATKAEEGHDMNISFKEMQHIVGSELAQKVRAKSIELYHKASLHAISKGIIIADSKFEFGLLDGGLILVDEIFTPDSSRFWPVASYESGRSQASLDKQFVRDYLESTSWDKASPPPPLPESIVTQTSARYMEIFFLLTGKSSL